MLETIKYLSSISLLAYVILLLKDELHMMQLNSYFNERYTKWLKENLASRFDTAKLVIMIVATAFCFVPMVAIQILLIAACIWGCYTLATRKAKKKLDFTPRARRLYAAEVLVVLIMMGIIYALTHSIQLATLVLVLATACSFIVIILANILAKPIESSINQWYINDAQKKINSYNNLIKIAITGSYGKTSTKHFLHSILSEKYNVLMTPGSYNTTLGVVRTIREFLQPAHEVFIIEMGAKKIGDVKEICDITAPQYSILTAIGPQHLETFGSLANVTKAKFEIISALPADGVGFVNFDNAVYTDVPANTKGKVVSFAVKGDAEYRAVNIAYRGIGMSFDVERKGEKLMTLETRLLGEHNVSNLLACVAVALELKVEKYQIERAVKNIEAVSHRLEVKRLPNGVTIIDDAFNSNPVGSKMALEALKRFEGKRKLVITPGMIELGAKEEELNFEFGKSIAANCDFAFLVGVNRTKPIQEGIKSVNFPSENLFVCKDLAEANEKVKSMMKEGDVVLYENDLPDTYNE